MSVRVAFDRQTDTTTDMYKAITSMEGVKVVKSN